MRTTSEYNPETNKGLYHEGRFLVLICDFDKLEIEEMYEDFSEAEQELIILDLKKEKEHYESNKGYDVRLEQGLYGHGH